MWHDSLGRHAVHMAGCLPGVRRGWAWFTGVLRSKLLYTTALLVSGTMVMNAVDMTRPVSKTTYCMLREMLNTANSLSQSSFCRSSTKCIHSQPVIVNLFVLVWRMLQEAVINDVNDGVMHHAAAEAGPEAGRHGILSLSWTFVVSFFSSLAPQQPPPVNANWRHHCGWSIYKYSLWWTDHVGLLTPRNFNFQSALLLKFFH